MNAVIALGLLLMVSPFLVGPSLDFLAARDKLRAARKVWDENATAETTRLPLVPIATHRVHRGRPATIETPGVHTTGGWRPAHAGRHAVENVPTSRMPQVPGVAA